MKLTKTKQLAAIIMALIIVVSGAIAIQAQSQVYASEYHYGDMLIIDDLMECNEFALYQEMMMLEYFGEVYMSNIQRAMYNSDRVIASFPMNRSGDTIYPEYFGGQFINSDGMLVVQLVESAMRGDSSDTMSNIEIYHVVNSDDVIIEMVAFSYAELTALMDTFVYFYFYSPDADSDIANNICSLHKDVINNRVVIELVTYNEFEIARIRNDIFDSLAIHFIESAGSAYLWTWQ
ncbi:MAG: hypothetical protein FWC77_03905 [Defluviitaleaceae bacterium]|nr:hypothetical protein [Defluviitaleaceae bacterium]